MKQRNKIIAVGTGLSVVILFFVILGGFVFTDELGVGSVAGVIGSESEEAQVSESGLITQDMVTGDGDEAAPGVIATVHYTGQLADGTVFDSSLNRGTPFQFVIGAGQVIQGWEEGISGMKVGGKRILVIPSELGYGSTQVGPIPPNSTLLFEVELLGVENLE
jgi:peptidylprolyl isomerase|tara:strand:+ start:14165 stop:14653 length:489 start_codon:yes stop_codon:yes gene_type:complete